MKILLIEDEIELQKCIQHYLEQDGYIVEIAENFSWNCGRNFVNVIPNKLLLCWQTRIVFTIFFIH